MARALVLPDSPRRRQGLAGYLADVDWNRALERVDRTRLYEFSATRVTALRGIRVAKGAALQGILTVKGSKRVPHG